ncbi:MAG: ABC transporter substrate-binding protein [Casimicrobiaceae bacterium]
MNNIRFTTIVSAALLSTALVGAAAFAQGDNIDRSATLKFSFVGAPAAYDPPFAKNQFQESAYTLMVYDTLVRLDEKGNILPSVAQSWSFSPDRLTLTMKLRPGMKFSDGSDVNAAAVARSLTRTKKDPASTLAGQLKSFESFEASDAATVVIKLNNADANVLYPLATSVGMIVSSKALDSGVNLALTPVGSGPYRLVSSGPQGANYERNDDYYDKSQNQFAKASIVPIVNITARMNALQTGQIDVALAGPDQWLVIDQMVKSGKFTVRKVLQPNSEPLWMNTKFQPFDNPKVRMAMNLAINRDAVSKGLENGQCEPAGQPLQPGVIGHDPNLKAYPYDVAKAKQLLQEAGVGPFSFDALVTVQEPLASVGVAMKQQLAAVGITMNIIPTDSSGIRPLFRQGKHAAMVHTLSVPAPDAASIIDAIYMSPDNAGGVTPEFAKAVADARTRAVGSPEREAAYKAVSSMAHDDPHSIVTCWSPVFVVARKGIVGVDKEPFLNAVPIPDIRTLGSVKSSS